MKATALASIAITLFLFCHQASSANPTVKFYTLNYDAPPESHFISLAGTMVIPQLPRAGVYYLWPGLQIPGNKGVYQNVLDGRTGSWWIASGYCCSQPKVGWGDGFGVSAGQTVEFVNVKRPSVWKSTLKRNNPGKTVSNKFALSQKTFNQAFFTVELYGVEWDFGRFEFRDVFISATGRNTSWCYAAPQVQNLGLNYHVGDVKATIYEGVTTCHIKSLILQSPLNKGSEKFSTNITTSTAHSRTAKKPKTSTRTATTTDESLTNPTPTAGAIGASPAPGTSTSIATAANSPTQPAAAAAHRLACNRWLLGGLLFFFA